MFNVIVCFIKYTMRVNTYWFCLYLGTKLKKTKATKYKYDCGFIENNQGCREWKKISETSDLYYRSRKIIHRPAINNIE